MSTIPIVLPAGSILIYGWGYEQSSNGIVPNNTIFKFGSVYQIWDGGAVFVYGGDEVMWKDGSETCKLAFDGKPFTQIPCRLVTKQIPPV